MFNLDQAFFEAMEARKDKMRTIPDDVEKSLVAAEMDVSDRRVPRHVTNVEGRYRVWLTADEIRQAMVNLAKSKIVSEGTHWDKLGECHIDPGPGDVQVTFDPKPVGGDVANELGDIWSAGMDGIVDGKCSHGQIMVTRKQAIEAAKYGWRAINDDFVRIERTQQRATIQGIGKQR